MPDRETKEFLLKEILHITKECLVYASQYDVEKLTAAIKTREGFVNSLKELGRKENRNEVDAGLLAEIFQAIDNETALLMDKMQICVTKFSNDLASLYDGKQVTKYF